MRRDLGLVRELLLLVEALDIPAGSMMVYHVGEDGGLESRGTARTPLPTISYG